MFDCIQFKDVHRECLEGPRDSEYRRSIGIYATFRGVSSSFLALVIRNLQMQEMILVEMFSGNGILCIYNVLEHVV